MVDEAAARWLTRLGEGEAARDRDIAFLRGLILSGAVAFILVPAAMTFLLPTGLALPVGAALVLSFMLIAAAIAFSFPRSTVVKNRDVAERQAEDFAFNACPGLALVIDPQGRVLRVGGRDRALFPPSLREAQGELLAERVHVSDRIGLVQAVDCLRQGANSILAEIRIALPHAVPHSGLSGRQFQHLNFDLTAIRDAEGNLVQIFAQASDLAREEMLRAEAAASLADARSAHETKSRFLAAVSHEMRTPLNAILGFSDVLAGEYFGRLENDRQREYVGLIRQSGAHLLSVVNTMLDMSRIEAGRYELLTEPFRVEEVIETCRAMLDLTARDKGVTLTARTARGLGEAVADRRALQQILINLAGNAIKFTGKGGVVSLDASVRGADLVISVSDTGIGIAEDKLALLGQPFMQVQNDYNRSYEGTGLGLSLVKGLVALHGGRFEIASKPGQGTVVTIALPLDGSGVMAQETEDETETVGQAAGGADSGARTGYDRVEFPPRLMSARQSAGQQPGSASAAQAALKARLDATLQTTMTDEKEFADGRAKAKIA
ncbi:MAG: HAMP domain-containing sensor histidine kinase [Neorhizobium sp.]|nr:HAMP domain-containing sensor histidine kinase [Neorhizobium sp.]